MKGVILVLSLFVFVGNLSAQKIDYPEVECVDENCKQILYRVMYKATSESSVRMWSDSIISPKLLVKSLKYIQTNRMQYSSKFFNKKYRGGKDFPRLEIYESDSVTVEFWTEVYKQKY